MSIPVACDCGRRFECDARLAGGFVNCPSCERAVAVPGLRDPLWRVLQVGAALLLFGVVCWTLAAGGFVAAVLAAIVGGALLWGLSRLL